MSLKAFHLFFILASMALGAGFGAWSFREAADAGVNGYYVVGVGSFLSTIGLGIYLSWFLRKTKKIGFIALAALLFSPRLVWGCPTCIVNSNSVMARSANDAVLLMLGLVVMLLVGFASLFIFWALRARSLRKSGLVF
jgi:hypothetical protein